jgi:hypothetical protein
MLTPVVHPREWDLMRVPVCQAPMSGYYEVYVGDDEYIRYYPDALPDDLKVKIAMVKAAHQLENPPAPHTPIGFHIADCPEGMENIGWKATDNLFCLILSRKEMNELPGERKTIDRSCFGWADYRGMFK